MKAEKPVVPQIAADPNLAASQAAAQKTLIDSLQVQAQADTNSLMTRYGTKMALSGAGMTPIADAATPTLPVVF